MINEVIEGGKAIYQSGPWGVIIFLLAVVIILIILFFTAAVRGKIQIGKLKIDLSNLEIPGVEINSKNIAILADKIDDLKVVDAKQDKEIRDLHGKLDSIVNDVGNMSRAVVEIRTDQNKQLFYTSDFPAIEKMIAGLKYIALGNNGDVKKDVKNFRWLHKDLYEGVVKLRPDLKLDDREEKVG